MANDAQGVYSASVGDESKEPYGDFQLVNFYSKDRNTNMAFFDQFPAFLETSQTGANANRLNKRHRAIFETDPEIFPGMNVLDIASHDGRWSFASVKAGARHVTGVEPRQHLVESANDTFHKYGVPDGSYVFVQDDIFKYLRNSRESFDVVLCLGFLYHTYRHPELLALIKRVNPKYLIVDSSVIKAKGLLCGVRKDLVEHEFEAYQEESTFGNVTFVATPSEPLLTDMLSHFNFEVSKVDWEALVGTDPRGIADYSERRRVTLICRAI